MKEITSIELVFENCESYEVESKYVGALSLEDITKQIHRMGCNYIGEYWSCKTCAIEIFAEGKREYVPFGLADHDKVDIFKRVMEYNDITSITLKYDDGSEEGIYVPYEDEVEGQLGAANIYQRTYINRAGDLFIVIGENILFEDYFPINDIEDETYQKFAKEMIMLD